MNSGRLRYRASWLFVAVVPALLVVATLWPVHALAVPSTPDSQRAARLIAQTREAATQMDVRGSAVVTWRTASHLQHATVKVRDARGAVAITAGPTIVVHDGQHTFLRDALGWTSTTVEPPITKLPSPSTRWVLSTRRGEPVAGRPTIEVLARRSDGTIGERLFVDGATHLLLRRDVLDVKGRVERGFAYSSVDVAAQPTRVTAPRGVATHDAEPVARMPKGYEAPHRAGNGFELVTRSRHTDGVLVFYSDGLFGASVFEQRGALDWTELPSGGTTTDVNGHDARRYEVPSGHVLVWEHNGTVYTCVSDAPSDAFAQMVGALGHNDRSTLQRVADFVLGPFSWA